MKERTDNEPIKLLNKRITANDGATAAPPQDNGPEENVEVETCGPGDPVGVMDIMNNSKVRTCSAYVASDVAILLSLSRETFLKRFLTIIPEMSTVFRAISHEREKRVKWLGKNIFEAASHW